MGRMKLRPMKKAPKGDMTRLSLLCGGPKASSAMASGSINCILAAEVTFVALSDRKLLTRVLAEHGWILSLVSDRGEEVEAKDGVAFSHEGDQPMYCPLCPNCARKLYGSAAYDRAMMEIGRTIPPSQRGFLG